VSVLARIRAAWAVAELPLGVQCREGRSLGICLLSRVGLTMGVEAHRIAVRATSTDRLGFTGRGEGLAARPVVLLEL
jgi:2C-methyl-D-erythritol 2,4-cyclodiphosphate synthase